MPRVVAGLGLLVPGALGRGRKRVAGLSGQCGQSAERGVASLDHTGPGHMVREVQDLLAGVVSDGRRGLEDAMAQALRLPLPRRLLSPSRQ